MPLHRIKKYSDFDWVFLAALFFLLLFGLLAIFSTSIEGEKGWPSNFHKQLIFILIGLMAFWWAAAVDYRSWKNYSGVLYFSGIVLLVLVLIFGKTIRGTAGWFSLGFFNIQPVELMKVFLIISLSKYFSRNYTGQVELEKFIRSFIYIAIPVFLAILQPDFGSAMVMVVIWLGLLLFSGMKLKYFAAIFLALGVTFLFSWNTFLKDYQKERVLTFINPQHDPLGSGYNVIQSLVAVGSGGIMGKGLGQGSQGQLNFLPEKHTDFIFASIAEETGLVGASIILSLFGVLFFRLHRTFHQSKDIFGKMLVGGVATMFFFHILVNIGMNLGIMPVAGLSLPFLSYGGSFVITCLFLAGLIQSIWRRRKKMRLDLEL